MRAYLYCIKIKILSALVYRFSLVAIIVSQTVQLIIGAYFWRAAYTGNDVVNGISLEQMLLYNVITVILSCIYVKNVENNIRGRVRQGDIALDFIKPINIFGIYFAEDLGQMVVNIALKIVPIIIISLLFIISPLPQSWLSFLLFLPSVALGYGIIWLTSAIFGMLYFWVIDLGPLGSVKDYIVMLLSGSLIPIWFFPESIQKILSFFPFIYIYQVPIGIYIGKTSPSEAVMQLLFQLVWCIVFFVLFLVMQKKVRSTLLVQGG